MSFMVHRLEEKREMRLGHENGWVYASYMFVYIGYQHLVNKPRSLELMDLNEKMLDCNASTSENCLLSPL